jgi:uncharacterized protein (DUF2141 family)
MNRLFVLAVMMLGFCRVIHAQEPAGPLTIRVTGFETDQGRAIVRLFREHDGMPKRPFLEVRGVIHEGKSTLVIDTLSYGQYAAIAFHDENDNGELDHSWGLPAEPLGFSGGWTLSLFSGMPTFEKLRFEFSRQNAEWTIQVR